MGVGAQLHIRFFAQITAVLHLQTTGYNYHSDNCLKQAIYVNLLASGYYIKGPNVPLYLHNL